ncbi:MAG: ATP-binding protein [Lachnospiraceae bacterium]|nr:ATP-binding protein [Lachnospiraceae bacterium]
MALTNEQYESIMRGYAEKRERHRTEALASKRALYLKLPEYKALDDEISSAGVSFLKKRLGDAPGGTAPASPESYASYVAALEEKKEKLLRDAGISPDVLRMRFDCPLCRDTGFVNGAKCRCFKQQETAILYDQSRLADMIRGISFSMADESYYEGEDLDRFRNALALCRQFVGEFGSVYRNLYFYGPVGTGKTFLSVCCAGELMRQGYSVLYFSAADLFDRLSAFGYDTKSRDEQKSLLNDLYDADLMIIDDLGTELTNTYTAARLFGLINERHLRRKSMVISTNLSLEDLQTRYSDRVFSRIVSGYELCKITGRDIRLAMKLNRKQQKLQS